jgi:hypothetical protein
MTGRRNKFWTNRSGAIAAEFALVLPLLLIFIFGIIDVGRAMWTWNRAEKATQAGARFAVATEMVSVGLRNHSFVSGGLTQGASIPESSFGGATCISTGCTCNTGATCPPLGALDTAAFGRIVARMRAMMPEIQAANVVVEYGFSGLGYAGDPNGPDVAPLVTVRLVNMQFQPVTFLLFGGTLNLPDFPATLSMEDGAGNLSN